MMVRTVNRKLLSLALSVCLITINSGCSLIVSTQPVWNAQQGVAECKNKHAPWIDTVVAIGATGTAAGLIVGSAHMCHDEGTEPCGDPLQSVLLIGGQIGFAIISFFIGMSAVDGFCKVEKCEKSIASYEAIMKDLDKNKDRRQQMMKHISGKNLQF